MLVLACACRFDLPSPIAPPGDAVTGGDAPADVGALDARLTCDPNACGVAGGACEPATGHCVLQTAGSAGVTCPAGHFCDITCAGGDGCRNGLVDCTNAAGCNIICGTGGAGDEACDSGVRCPATGPCAVRCNGGLACRHGMVACGAGPCMIECLGADACGDFGVDCRQSMDCEVRCVGANACINGGVTCGPGSCDVTCDGQLACLNLPQTCAVLPAACAFHCCGTNACGNDGGLCSTCTKDAVCP